MKLTSVTEVLVYYHGSSAPVLVGTLALQGRDIWFEYSAEFIASKLNLSPFNLPLKSEVVKADYQPFEGLFGLFNDSLPDGWGRLLLDRQLAKLNHNPKSLSPLDRLCYVGNNGMGALSYEPANIDSEPLTNFDLDHIAQEVADFQEQNAEEYLEELIQLGGSSAGARPKALVNIENQEWLIKFRSSHDPLDIGNIEYAYHLMAKEAKLDIPAAKLFPAKKGSGYFGSVRFDRIGSRKIHMHTVSGLLHADHRYPSLDYETILQATLHLTRDQRECEKQFRNATFNILSHNRDDHAKNFAFLMDANGKWQTSPAYDLTFSAGPSGEHCTTVLGEGKNPTPEHLLQLAAKIGIKQNTAKEIIGEVSTAIGQWEKYAKEADVSFTSRKMIAAVLQQISNI